MSRRPSSRHSTSRHPVRAQSLGGLAFRDGFVRRPSRGARGRVAGAGEEGAGGRHHEEREERPEADPADDHPADMRAALGFDAAAASHGAGH
jgi:hypothetical protein